MTLVCQRQVQGPAAHALVIGVGAYPQAKTPLAQPDTPKPLRNVADLPSAATGADAFCDWLISEAQLPVALATVEILKNGPNPAHGQYSWHGRLNSPGSTDPRGDIAVEEPTTPQVTAAGTRWINRLKSAAGNVGLLYICGHGAVLSSHPIVFLADLNGNAVQPWGAFLDVYDAAIGLKQIDQVAAAHLFVDACGELIPEIELSNIGAGAKFVRSDPFKRGSEKVSLLAAAAPNYLTYEDKPETGGRFTLTLLRALRGAAARSLNNQARWFTYPHAIHEDLKCLYCLQAGWGGQPFEPAPPLLPSEASPIVVFGNPPEIIVQIRLDPQAAINDGDLLVLDAGKTRPALYTRLKDGSFEWTLPMQASIWPHFLVAEFPPGGAHQNQELMFAPSRSLFNYTIKVSP